jgi:phosphoribosylanthranilate isomerase
MTEIKICGITNPEDALAASACGVDALGFIFYPKSPRYVAPEKAREIIAALPKEIVTVGVFVDHDVRVIAEIREFCRLDLIQLHGDESPEYCRHFSASLLIKAVSPRSRADLGGLRDYLVRAILVDCRDRERYGGTGRPANWHLAAKIGESYPLILAGGLCAGNIREALAMVSPRAVDINSGVESSPGEKDPEKMKNIVDIIRQSTPAGTGRGERVFHRPHPRSPTGRGVDL